jgi:hypothetical protein
MLMGLHPVCISVAAGCVLPTYTLRTCANLLSASCAHSVHDVL